MMIDLLHHDTQLMSIQGGLHSENKLKRHQSIQTKYFKYWDKLIDGKRSTDELLSARMTGPHINITRGRSHRDYSGHKS